MDVREVKIRIRKVEPEGKKAFNAYKAILADGTQMDAKFTKDVNPALIPTKTSIVVVPSGEMNISHKKEYPVLWINEVVVLKDLATEQNAQSEEELTELFGKLFPNEYDPSKKA